MALIVQTATSVLPYEEQTRLFIDCLHGNNTGYINLPHKGNNGTSWFNTYALLKNRDYLSKIHYQNDSYISVNCFDSATHKSDNCSHLNGIFIDIDILHTAGEYDIAASDLLINKCLSILEDKISKQELLEPTIIVLSGRGLAFYYLYKQPICTTRKDAVLFHDALYKKVITIFQELFNTPEIEVDTKIKDKSRVCRLPGTYNSKAGRAAILYKLNSDSKYDFAQLCSLAGVDTQYLLSPQEPQVISDVSKATNPAPKGHAKTISVRKPFESSTYFSKQAKDVARSRIDWLNKLVRLRTYLEGTGRHELVFITYCHLKQLFSIEESRKKIHDFNQLLTTPLVSEEFSELLDTVDTHHGSNGINGTYIFSNETLKALLALTSDEIKELGIDRNADIKKQRKTNLQKAEERDRLVCKLFLDGLSHKQIVKELPAQYSCSLKTVKRITLRYGLDSSRSQSFDDIDFQNNRIYSRNRHYDPEMGSTFTILGEGERQDKGEGIAVPSHTERGTTDYLSRLLSGKNTFITGDAGCGKTHLLRQFINTMYEQNKNVLITAPTNKAADNISGLTLHRAFQLEARAYSEEDTIKASAFLPLENIDAVIVDEISMVPYGIFQQIIRIIRFAENFYSRHIQIVLCGDFNQLPPIPDTEEPVPSVHYLFEYSLWEELGFNSEIIYLDKVFRQSSDPALYENLKRIKNGNLSALAYFNTRVNHSYRFSESAVHLCAYRDDVNLINKICISRHENDTSYSTIEWEPYNSSSVDAPTSFPVYVGMPIIATENTGALCKGSLGHISEVKNGVVLVTMSDGKTVHVEPITLPLEKDRLIRKMPIEPAYAITIHKAQGMTLDKAILHPHCFAEGQLYTALSRVTTLSGLILAEKIRSKDLIISSVVIDFYKKLQEK